MGRCRTLPPWVGPGPRAAATPSDEVSGDLWDRVGLLSRREGPQAGGAAELTGGLGNSGLSDHKPTAPPLGSANVLLGLGARRGGKGLCREAWPPGGSQAPGLTSLSPRLFCGCPGAQGTTLRAQPAGRRAGGSTAKQLCALPGLLLVAKAGTGAQKLKGWPRRHQWQPITGAHSARSPITTRRCTSVQSHSSTWSLNQSEQET